MPPLEMAPGSYFAAKGSAEHDELISRATHGDFEVWNIRSESGKSDIYDIFTPDNKSAQIAGPAFAMEQALEQVLLHRIYPPDEREGHDISNDGNANQPDKINLAHRIGRALFNRRTNN
jgi:hypothetical protein